MKRSTPEDDSLLRLPRWVPVVIAAVSVPLLGHIYAGTAMRYVGDDYCYAMVLRQHGFWGAQVASYLGPSPYHGNRFSLTLFADLSGLIGPSANAILPGIAILLLVFTTAYLAAGLFRFGGRRLGPGAALAAGGWITFATLDQSPDVVQSIYWRPGMLPYTAPLIGILGLAAFILDRSGRGRIRPGTLAATALAGLIVGGFSETGAALLLAVLLLLLLAGAFLARRGSASPSLLRLSAAGLLGTTAAIALLASSPAIADLLADASPAPVASIRMATYHAYLFTHGSVKHLFLQNLVTAAPFFAAGLLYTDEGALPPRTTAIALWLLPILCFALSICRGHGAERLCPLELPGTARADRVAHGHGADGGRHWLARFSARDQAEGASRLAVALDPGFGGRDFGGCAALSAVGRARHLRSGCLLPRLDGALGRTPFGARSGRPTGRARSGS